jgi:5,10-methylenetetrahydromethanopterin reductase
LSKPERELGLGLQSDKTANEYVRIGQQAEAAGFDVVSVFHDLGFQPAIVPLTLIAHATDRIRLGPAALNPYTLHPFEIANQIAALDRIRHVPVVEDGEVVGIVSIGDLVKFESNQ